MPRASAWKTAPKRAFNLRLADDARDRLVRYAAATGTTASALVEEFARTLDRYELTKADPSPGAESEK